MNAPRLAALAYGYSAPLSLIWQDPAGRFSMEIPFRVLPSLREFFTAPDSSGAALLTAKTRDGGFLLDFEIISSSELAELQDILHKRSKLPGEGSLCVGFAVDQALASFPSHDRGQFQQLMLEVHEPRAFLSARRDGDSVSATLFLWSAATNSSEPIGVAFPLDGEGLESQYYAPFTPVFFEGSSVVRSAAVPVEMARPDAPRPRLVVAPTAEIEAPLPAELVAQPTTSVSPVAATSRAVPRLYGWAAVVLLLGVGGAVAYTFHARSSRPVQNVVAATPAVIGEGQSADLGMSVTLKGSVMEIHWDKDSPAAKSARSARVDIWDGAENVSVLLNSAQLTLGRLLYGPYSSDTRIQLQFITPTGTVEDRVRVIQAGSAEEDNNRVSRSRVESSDTLGRRDTPMPRPAQPDNERPRPRSVRKIFVPPTPKAKAPSEVAVMEVPQLTLARLVPPPSAPKVDVLLPSPAPNTATARIVTPPVALGNPVFYVPPTLRTQSMAGKVVSVKLYLDKDGFATQVDTPQLAPRLSALINDTVRRWRFKPATSGGKRVPSEMIIYLKFPAR